MPTHPENLHFPSQAKTSASTTTLPPWNPIGDLSAAHIEMIKKHVEGMGATRIRYHMKRMGEEYSKTHIVRVIQSAKGREVGSLYSALYYGGMNKLVEQATAYAPEALSTVLGIMRNPIAGSRHQLAAADSIMDRVGPVKVSRQEVENQRPTTVVINLLPSQLSQFLQPPPVVEAEVVTLPEVSSASSD